MLKKRLEKSFEPWQVFCSFLSNKLTYYASSERKLVLLRKNEVDLWENNNYEREFLGNATREMLLNAMPYQNSNRSNKTAHRWRIVSDFAVAYSIMYPKKTAMY